MEADGKVVKQAGALGYYARVRVSCHGGGEQRPAVSLDPQANDSWQREQGWLDAALAGAALGLKLARASGSCTVTRVHGMVCDTNPTLVAIAAIRAVWAAVAFVPDEALARCLEACILLGSELTPAGLERELTA